MSSRIHETLSGGERPIELNGRPMECDHCPCEDNPPTGCYTFIGPTVHLKITIHINPEPYDLADGLVLEWDLNVGGPNVRVWSNPTFSGGCIIGATLVCLDESSSLPDAIAGNGRWFLEISGFNEGCDPAPISNDCLVGPTRYCFSPPDCPDLGDPSLLSCVPGDMGNNQCGEIVPTGHSFATGISFNGEILPTVAPFHASGTAGFYAAPAYGPGWYGDVDDEYSIHGNGGPAHSWICCYCPDSVTYPEGMEITIDWELSLP